MRRIISILLILTFVSYLGGLQIMYWVKMSVCKEQVQLLVHGHKLSRKNTINFSFTPSEYKLLSWSEENKEFIYQEQRYDIVGIQYFSDEIILKCYSDKDETNLVDAFSGFIKKMFSTPQHNNDSNNDIASKICKEYLPTEPFKSSFYVQALTSINADCVLVNASAKIDDIWHPPTLV